jgi:hypothetical protein
MLFQVWFFIRGVRLLTGKVILERLIDHGAPTAPCFFVQIYKEINYVCNCSPYNLL